MNGQHRHTAACRWERYQKSGSYEDLTNWLKHRAYCRILSEEMSQCLNLTIRGRA